MREIKGPGPIKTTEDGRGEDQKARLMTVKDVLNYLDHVVRLYPTMTAYSVQYILPVDNPVDNVSMSKRKGTVTFFVPVNHPDAHLMGYEDLVKAQRRSGLLVLSTPLNNKSLTLTKESSIKKPE